jgi:PAS domain S-box-containing protein
LEKGAEEMKSLSENNIPGQKSARMKPVNSRRAKTSRPLGVKFEHLITEISTRFINLAPEDLDNGINEALAKIGKSAGVDHSAVFLFKNGHGYNTYEWCARGIRPLKDRLQRIPIQSFPWYMAKLRQGETIHVPRAEDLPPEARSERGLLQSLRIKSLVAVPMVQNDLLIGFLGFDSVRREKSWTDDSIALLKMVAEIFARTLEHQKTEEYLRQSENKYRALFEGIPVGLYRTSPEGKFLDLNPAMLKLLGCENKESVVGRCVGDFNFDPKDQQKSFATMARDGVLQNFEFRLKRADGLVIWVRDNATAVRDSNGEVIHHEGSLLNISRQKQEEADLQNRTEQVIRHQAALLELGKLDFSDLDAALRKITEIAAQTLELDRVSVWFFDSEHTEIRCRDLYSRQDNGHDRGMVLKANDYPAYFRALEDSCVIAADSALSDPRTREFSDCYLKPLKIVSMMDIPIRRRGEIVGIICHEHTGAEKKWALEEQHFAISVGDTMTLALEALERRRTERVNESIFKISEAANSTKSLKELFYSIHQVISGLMPANNFYIALYDSDRAILSFPYFVDEFDPPPAPKKLGRGLTEYVLRTGRPLLASPEVFEELIQRGEVESIGAPSIDWLGVPLNLDSRTIGVLVVQTYTEGLRYSEDDRNILKFVCDQIAMVIHRKKTEEDVQERERFLISMFESIQDGISILGKDYTILRVNKAIEKWYAHALPVVGKKCYEAYHLRDKPCEICPTRKALETSEAAYEVVAKVGTGGVVTGWIDLYSFPLIDSKTGQMKGVIEYVRDITERKMAEDRLQASLQEKEVLLREIHHRVKNNMQVISSLLNLQSRHIQDSAVLEMFKESQRRIRSMALIHERLYQSSDLSRIEFSQYLRNLATHLFHSYQVDSSRIQLRIEAEEVHLNINTAIPCGLIVNELISNALKHAFPEGRSGSLDLNLRRVAGDGYVLRVKDDGMGFPETLDFRKTETLGMQIVSTLVSQIDGSIDLAREMGTEFIIHFEEIKYAQRT